MTWRYRVLPKDEVLRSTYYLTGDGRTYRVKEPPWWRPLARRRFRLGIRILRYRALEELTPPPS